MKPEQALVDDLNKLLWMISKGNFENNLFLNVSFLKSAGQDEEKIGLRE